jgi:hypothetical protein
MDLIGYFLWSGLCCRSLSGRQLLPQMQFGHHGAASVMHCVSVVETFFKRDFFCENTAHMKVAFPDCSTGHCSIFQQYFKIGAETSRKNNNTGGEYGTVFISENMELVRM